MPSRQEMCYVIVYDVVENSPCTKLANILLDYGIRVQKSVFEADLTREDVEEILQKVSKYIEAGDSLRIYPALQELCFGSSEGRAKDGTRCTLPTDCLKSVSANLQKCQKGGRLAFLR